MMGMARAGGDLAWSDVLEGLPLAPGGGMVREPAPQDEALLEQAPPERPLLFVNPPAPDGETWIRCQHRAAQRAPDGMVWPQVALAQLAALFPDRQTVIIDANARRLGWPEVAAEIARLRPRWYITQVAGPTLEHDLAGLAAAKRAGAATVVFGPLVSPVAYELLRRFSALDYVLCGEPEVTLRELVDVAERRWQERPPQIARLCQGVSQAGRPRTLDAVRGLAWRREGEITLNPLPPLIPQLDDLPLPAHQLLPLGRSCGPAIQAPAAVVVTGRGCPGECCFCLKHVTYRQTVRVRSPESIVEEMHLLQRLGVRHVYMQADLFTVCRDQVRDLCRLLSAEGLGIGWSCSARVDSVDEEILHLMGQAQCRRITWAIESGSDALLWRAGKRTRAADVEQVLGWASAAGICNWGSFTLGLPGETEQTIQQSISLAKRLSLERAVFELAVPRPGTPFWEQATLKQWLAPGARWEDGDAGGPAIVEYPGLSVARLEQGLERAYREWALRPGSCWGQLRRMAQPRREAAWEWGSSLASRAV